jgi:NhaP-type Na+/H+ or K+/H+ antiporter
MPDSPLSTIAVAVLLGVAGQVIASLTRVPAIVFLLLLGVAAGPGGLDLVRPDDLGGGLPALTSVFVAIILFEGGLTLRPELLRQAGTPVRRLVTVGALVTLLGAALLARLLAGLPWPVAFLFGSLVTVTGPTVIAPILRRVRLRPRLHAVLKSESILIDPLGVFVAVVTLEYVVALATHQASWAATVGGFCARVGIGALVGGLTGAAAVALARLRVFHKPHNRHLVLLGALGLALGAYALAEEWQSESGIMAVIVAGLLLAAYPIPSRQELEQFKDHLTTLGVSVLFILLAAHLPRGMLARVGWREAALPLGLMLVVRPAAVLLSTRGTPLTGREKAYLSLMAPRGIVAAAMASHFAGQLRGHGLAGADAVEALVYLTVGATVCVQGGWASRLARLLRVRAEPGEGVLLVGVNEWSLALAEALRSWGRFVLFADNNAAHCDTARARGFAAHQGDATRRALYEQLDLSPLGVLVAMTPNDAVNTLACEAAQAWLGGKNVLQVISKPVGDVPGSGVRMAGRWALPTHHPHREMARLLHQRRLHLDTEACDQPVTLSHRLTTARGPMVPLLVLDDRRLRIAVHGYTCPVHAVIVGLVPDRRSAGADGAPPTDGPAAGS